MARHHSVFTVACLLPSCAAVLALKTTPAWADIVYLSTVNDGIEKFAPSGVASNFARTQGPYPEGLAFDSAGNLYAAAARYGPGSDVEKFTPNGVGSVFFDGSSGYLYDPQGLAFDNTGKLYAASRSGNYIEIVSSATFPTLFAIGLSFPAGIAFDKAGNLYVANQGNNTITKFTSDGVGSIFANSGLNQPQGLAFDSAGNLYVANAASNTIEEFTPEGVGSVFADTGLDVPVGIAFDSAGDLYVANQNSSTIEKFTPDGIGSVFADTTGMGAISYIAIYPGTLPVPEPSSLALLGLGGVGLLTCLRRV